MGLKQMRLPSLSFAVTALVVAACASAAPSAAPSSAGAPASAAPPPASASGSSASGAPASGAVASFTPPPEPTSPVTVSFMGGDWMQGAPMDAIVGPFEKLHPNIKVDFVPVAFDDMTTKAQSTVGQGQATPDVYMVDQPRVPGWAAANLLMDLTGKVPELSGLMYQDSIDQSSYNGVLYALPAGESSGMGFYNKDLLAKANVTPPTADPSAR